jgi:prolipoprotein diacylglyceryltransferase
MYPVLFTLGSFTIYYLSLSYLVLWIFFSFLFWRSLKDQGVEDERIFSLTFQLTLTALVFSRLGYVLTHFSAFRDNWLGIAVPWAKPGFNFVGAAVGVFLVLLYWIKVMKIKPHYVFDAFVYAFPFAHAIGSLGAILDGAIIGKTTMVSWAVSFIGQEGKRHPVGFYAVLVDVLVISVYLLLKKISLSKPAWPRILPAVVSFWLFAMLSFTIEFFVDSAVYFFKLTLNQWLFLAIFSELSGALFIITGGKKRAVSFIGRLYERFSSRFIKKDQKPAGK